MNLKSSFRATSLALVVGGATAALLACGGSSSGDLPTTAALSSSAGATVSASDLTASGDRGGAASSTAGRPEGPPTEALAACAVLTAESACTFTSPRDGSAVDGICRARRDDSSQLVCFPDDWDGRGPGGGHQGPPEQALAVCEGTATGTTCSFEAPFGTVSGACRTGRDGATLVCAPTDGPPR